MNMKFTKLLSIVFTMMLTLTLIAGCGGAKSEGGSAGGSKILYTLTDEDDTFRATLSDAIRNAAKDQGVTLDVQYCGNDIEEQKKQIAGAKAAGYDAIICRLVDTSTALQMEVVANGLPIIFVNNEPDKEYLKEDEFVCVASYEQDAGKFQAEYVWNKLGKPSSLNLIILEGEKGHSGAIGRTNAVKYFFRDNQVDANIVFMDNANWSDTEAYEKLDVFKMTGQPFDAIICNNDTMALGAVKWLKDNGYDTSKYLVAGVDATADGCQSIVDGGMYMTVLQDAGSQGARAVEAAVALGNGKSLSSIEGASKDHKYVWVPFVPVDATNVNEYK